MVDTYTRANTAEMKEKVLSSFSVPNGRLRVVVATTFSMGIDCPDIHQIIDNLQQYDLLSPTPS